MMNSEFIKKEKSEVTLKLTISSGKFEEAIQKAYNKSKTKLNVPGFRKGKAPRKLIEAQYGKGVFFDEAINIVFPAEYSQAAKEYDLQPIDSPQITDVKETEDNGLVLTVVVAVKPDVKLGEYKGIEVEKIEYTVKEEDADAKLEALREQNARYITVEDRPVQDKDMLSIDFDGSVDGVPFEGGKGENFSLVIGSKTFIPGFEDQLIGAKCGEEVEVNVTFPETYHAETLAGKPALFKVKINEIKIKELQELNDEFAKDVSEFDTLAELKDDAMRILEENAQKKATSELRNKIVDAAAKNSEVEIPQVMVDNQVENMIKDFEYQLQYQGLNLDSYMQFTGATIEDLKNQMKVEAEQRVKTSLVLEAISAAEKIEVTQEEVDNEIASMATTYKMEVDKFKSSLRAEDMDYFKDNVVMTKTIDVIVESAKIA